MDKNSRTTPLGDTLADGWNLSPIQEICSLIGSGSTPKGGKSRYKRTGVPFVRSQNVYDHKFSKTGLVFLDEETDSSLGSLRILAEDVLINITGDGDTIARCCVAPKNLEGARSNQHVIVIRTNERAIPSFLQRQLSNPAMREHMLRQSSGASRRALTKGQISGLLIPLPSIREQQAITEILGALDDKIAVNERIITLYDELLQAHFDHIANPNAEHGGENTLANNLIDFNPRTAKPEEEIAIYVDMSALPTDRAPITTWSHRKPKSGSKFTNGDTLLARITPCLENGKTGYVDFMSDGQVGMGSTEFIVMRTRPGIPQEFSYFLARNKHFRNHAIQKMSGTSGRQRVSASDASEFLIRKPTEEELNSFGSQSSRAFAHMKSLTSESRTLAELRDTLLPQLMSGKLRVKDAEKIVEDNV